MIDARHLHAAAGLHCAVQCRRDLRRRPGGRFEGLKIRRSRDAIPDAIPHTAAWAGRTRADTNLFHGGYRERECGSTVPGDKHAHCELMRCEDLLWRLAAPLAEKEMARGGCSCLRELPGCRPSAPGDKPLKTSPVGTRYVQLQCRAHVMVADQLLFAAAAR